ncbi:Mitochondrial Protein Translocase (MPT) Family [Phytophthora nicotianae]|uniref:Mitochondrial Protein Translocase (MPT) Family n=1 Tax=Phytophthora nicotianae TaxID=4792 RepID=A0A0W8D697_PHYNI|nr:Mitochondrial Protein Translocase (MPT) Family [Phytophthora nicotianae]
MSGKEAWKPFVKFEYQNLLPAELRNKLRKMLVFTEATGTKQVNQSPAVSQGYRYPSPDKQAEGVSVPSSDSKESIYNIQYYTRDIRRFPFPTEVGMHPSIPVEKRAEIPADAKRGSPGNKNPAVLRYDPTGTRSAMSTTHEARDKLILQHASTHNVRFEWEGDAEKDILEDLEAKNLPPTPGRPFVWDFPSQSRVMRCQAKKDHRVKKLDVTMQFTVMPELPTMPAPEVVAKTDQSITLRVHEHGYVYYSWNDSVLFTGKMFPVKGLKPNTTYVFRVRVVDEAKRQCGEWSPLTAYTRTFTEEEDAKRSGTVFEHALKLEREQKSILQGQISKLTGMLDERKTARENDNKVQQHEDMLASRRVIDTRLMKLQQELSSQTAALQTIKSQRAADEQMITELLNEQEKLRATHNEQQGQAQFELEMQTLRAQLEKNEEALRKHQEQVNASHEQIANYETSLEAKKTEISQKEEEVERIMADCNRMVQEQADLAHVKQLEVEDALLEAKTSLEQQLDINTYLREEVSRLREENHHLKNQIEEVDSEVVPKLVRLEDENEQLRAQLSRR